MVPASGGDLFQVTPLYFQWLLTKQGLSQFPKEQDLGS